MDHHRIRLRYCTMIFSLRLLISFADCFVRDDYIYSSRLRIACDGAYSVACSRGERLLAHHWRTTPLLNCGSPAEVSGCCLNTLLGGCVFLKMQKKKTHTHGT